MTINPVLAQPIDVTLSLSDWLTLVGWMSAHLTDATADLTVNNVREIGVQVVAKARAVTSEPV